MPSRKVGKKYGLTAVRDEEQGGDVGRCKAAEQAATATAAESEDVWAIHSKGKARQHSVALGMLCTALTMYLVAVDLAFGIGPEPPPPATPPLALMPSMPPPSPSPKQPPHPTIPPDPSRPPPPPSVVGPGRINRELCGLSPAHMWTRIEGQQCGRLIDELTTETHSSTELCLAACLAMQSGRVETSVPGQDYQTQTVLQTQCDGIVVHPGGRVCSRRTGSQSSTCETMTGRCTCIAHASSLHQHRCHMSVTCLSSATSSTR